MYKKELEKQLGFLKRSCKMYDEGNEDEAIRIAVILKTLFHDGGRNTISLLTHLQQKNSICLLSTLETIEEYEQKYHLKISVMTAGKITSEGIKPWLDDTNKKIKIKIDKWLNEKIFLVNKVKYSRNDIIGIARDNDGGAHVDKPKQKVKYLKEGDIGKLTYTHNGRKIIKKPENHHYIFLRQFAYEVLNSTELYELNNIGFQKHEEEKSYSNYITDGINFYKQEKYLKSLEAYKNAIRVSSDNSEIAYNNIGNTYATLKEYDEAKDAYLYAISQNSKYIDPLFNLSIIYEKEKKYDKAIELYKKILNIDVNHMNARHNLKVVKNFLKFKE